MITFYPRNIGRWRRVFDFEPSVTLTPKEKTDHKVFYDRDELIGFLKQHGVRLDDVDNPLTIKIHGGTHPTLGVGVYDVHQWTLLGWIKDDCK